MAEQEAVSSPDGANTSKPPLTGVRQQDDWWYLRTAAFFTSFAKVARNGPVGVSSRSTLAEKKDNGSMWEARPALLATSFNTAFCSDSKI